jgi:hypothetical protein
MPLTHVSQNRAGAESSGSRLFPIEERHDHLGVPPAFAGSAPALSAACRTAPSANFRNDFLAESGSNFYNASGSESHTHAGWQVQPCAIAPWPRTKEAHEV